MIDPHEAITLERDCEASLIPQGTPIQLPVGSIVYITQALGGSYTVNVNGNLARIEGRDADALGQEIDDDAATAMDTDDGTVNEAMVWERLKTCYDPEIAINIVDLGLIYTCDIQPMDGDGYRVDIKMTLTAAGCGMGDFLVEDVRSKTEQIPNVVDVDVQLVFDPPWTQDMMSEAAKLQTGMYY